MKVAIIGMGHMGQIHLNTAREWGAEIVPFTYGADVVVVASPDYSHSSYVESLLDEGRAVFCEKPIACHADIFERIEKLAEKAPLGCHLPLRQFADEFEIQGNTVKLLYDYGRRDKFLSSWRNHEDYDLVMGGGIHMMDLWMLKSGCREIDVSWTSRVKTRPEAICPDLFVGKFYVGLGPHRGTLQVDFTRNGPHRHVISWDGGEWINEKPTDKSVQLRAFLDNPKTDLLAIASHRACLKFQNV